MIYTINNFDELFNQLIKINSENPNWYTNRKNVNVPISNHYFLTIVDNESEEIINFLSYLDDNTRPEYPFKKDLTIDYSFMIEQEQFCTLEIKNNLLTNISNQIDLFFKIVKESDGEITFVLDIKFLLDFLTETKNKSQPNHLIDLILYKINNKINNIVLFDKNDLVKNKSNLFYIQLESCLKGFNPNKYILDKNILVYRDSESTVIESVYWNLLYSEIKINQHIKKIKSPYDESFFDLVKISNKICFLYKVNIQEIIYKNLINLENEPGIIVEPLDRFNIYL
jgi:hypothetical protein